MVRRNVAYGRGICRRRGHGIIRKGGTNRGCRLRRLRVVFGLCVSVARVIMAVLTLGSACHVTPRRRIGTEQLASELKSNVLIHRAGMRFLLLHAQFGQHIDDHAGFHFKLPSQLVDSDLLHRWDSFLHGQAPPQWAMSVGPRLPVVKNKANGLYNSFKHHDFMQLIRVFNGIRFNAFAGFAFRRRGAQARWRARQALHPAQIEHFALVCFDYRLLFVKGEIAL